MNYGKDRIDRADRKENQTCRTDRTGMLVRKHRRRARADVSLASARNRHVLHYRDFIPRILRCPRLAVEGERISQMLDFHF